MQPPRFAVRDTVVIVLMGIPGSGKTTLANEILSRFRARLVSRDVVRAAMFQPCSFTPEEKAASFRAVTDAVATNCELGHSTIVEGMPFSRVGEVEAVQARAGEHGVRTVTVLCNTPIEVAQQRVRAQRRAGVPMADDRGAELVAEVAARFRSPPEGALVLDTTRPVATLADEVIERASVTARSR
jgi:predicted kinase